MPMNNDAMVAQKARRARVISEIIAGSVVQSQEQLREMLRAHGIEATQATLSRDLRELGVVKTAAGYALPEPGHERVGRGERQHQVERGIKNHLVDADTAGNLAVLKTNPGNAQALAVVLDGAGVDGVVGTLAGDDTIFLACKSGERARSIVHRFRTLAGIA
jgi:transcriptional regulator of arginine metabolism